MARRDGSTKDRRLRNGFVARDKLFSFRYICALVSLFLVSGGNWILVSPLTVFVRAQTNSSVIAGFVVTGYAAGALIMRLLGSPFILSRNYGWFVVLGGVVFGMGSAISLATKLDVVVLLAMRFAQGFGQGVASVAIQAGVAYIVPRARLGEGISIIGTASTLAMAVLPAAGLFLASSGDCHGYVFLLAVSIVFMIAVVVFGLYLQRSIGNAGKPCMSASDASGFARLRIDADGASACGRLSATINGDAKRKPSYADASEHESAYMASTGKKRSFKGFERGAVFPSIVNATVAYCQGFVTAFMPLLCLAKGFGNAGVFFAVFSFAILAIRLLSGRLMMKYSPRTLVMFGFVCGSVGMAAAPFVPEGLIWLPAVLVGICAGFVNPHLQVVAVTSCSHDAAGSATGLFMTFVDIGMTMGTAAGGFIIDAVGYAPAFLSGVGILALGLLLYVVRGKNAPIAPNAERKRG